MKRNEWLFRYTVADLLGASRERLAYHEQRRDWWNGEYKAAAAKAKDAGVEVREYQVTGGMNAQMVIDPGLQARINECSQKRETHRKRAEEFAQWVAVLESQAPSTPFDVTMDDALFFGVAKQEPEA
jgi:predicted ATPase